MNNQYGNKYIEYKPDVVYPPGDTLIDVLEDRGMSSAQLAQKTGCSLQTIDAILQGKAVITPDIAVRLEKALGASADFWIRMEEGYQTFLVESQEKKKLGRLKSWLKQFSFKDMIKLRWLCDAGKRKVSQI